MGTGTGEGEEKDESSEKDPWRERKRRETFCLLGVMTVARRKKSINW